MFLLRDLSRLIKIIIISFLLLFVLLFLILRLPAAFPEFHADAYVAINTVRLAGLGNITDDEYIERMVDLINSTEIRRETFREGERRPTPNQSPCEIISFIRSDGRSDCLWIRGDAIDYRYVRFIIVDMEAFRAELEALYQEIKEVVGGRN